MWCRGERLRALYHVGSWDELRARRRRGRALGSRSTAAGRSRCSRYVYVAEVLVHRGSARRSRRTRSRAPATGTRERRPAGPRAGSCHRRACRVRAMDGHHGPGARLRVRAPRHGAAGRHGARCAWPGLYGSRQRSGEHRARRGVARRLGARRRRGTAARAPAARATIAEARGAMDEAAAALPRSRGALGRMGIVVEQAYALLGLGRCGDAKALRARAGDLRAARRCPVRRAGAA